MPVWEVTLTAPNGARVQGPIVAKTADEAMDEMAARHNVPFDDKSFQLTARQRSDPDGRLEQLLTEGEKRQQEADFYRQ